MIDILLATFNGGEFIENQLLSIIAQTYKNWRLIVHDDGSADDTMVILKKYQSLDPRIHIIEDNITCQSAAKNFLHLLSYVKSEFIIFCDQDDIWFESKLQVLFDGIKSETEPTAVYCNAFAYNGIHVTRHKVSLFERTTLQNSLFLNSGVQGCSLMFNRALLNEIIDFPAYIIMHDHFVTMSAISFGKLKYIDLSLMLYRQHQKNVTGNVALTFADRVRSFIDRNTTILDRGHYEANKSFYLKFRHKFTQTQSKMFEAYLKFPDLNLLEKIYTILKYDFRIGSSRLVLLLKVFLKRTIN
ncbi:glycosyltransferase family 2 protein [Sphingobacterium thalpophilum]|uniref:glycosyltransferase family 2 protein n=1 Tax=Sphingobacterium thalpophilum TaxID=259 RepID=UPI003C74D515